jgi:hypothetical protein
MKQANKTQSGAFSHCFGVVSYAEKTDRGSVPCCYRDKDFREK